ncbi:MAG: hypothetical protein LBL34_05930 [Clostridiales bacterium]|jgi:hypothetical protein|nr:hypothetical protein [Clostridiales bacterium]
MMRKLLLFDKRLNFWYNSIGQRMKGDFATQADNITFFRGSEHEKPTQNDGEKFCRAFCDFSPLNINVCG